MLVVAVLIPTLETNIAGVPDKPKEVVAKETDEIPVRFAPLPTKDVAVITPDAFTPATVILGLPERPVALPVSAPTKVVAVAVVLA